LNAFTLCSTMAALDLDKPHMAALCGVHPRTVQRWRVGDSRVPSAVATLLRAELARREEAGRVEG